MSYDAGSQPVQDPWMSMLIQLPPSPKQNISTKEADAAMEKIVKVAGLVKDAITSQPTTKPEGRKTVLLVVGSTINKRMSEYEPLTSAGKANAAVKEILNWKG